MHTQGFFQEYECDQDVNKFVRQLCSYDTYVSVVAGAYQTSLHHARTHVPGTLVGDAALRSVSPIKRTPIARSSPYTDASRSQDGHLPQSSMGPQLLPFSFSQILNLQVALDT